MRVSPRDSYVARLAYWLCAMRTQASRLALVGLALLLLRPVALLPGVDTYHAHGGQVHRHGNGAHAHEHHVGTVIAEWDSADGSGAARPVRVAVRFRPSDPSATHRGDDEPTRDEPGKGEELPDGHYAFASGPMLPASLLVPDLPAPVSFPTPIGLATFEQEASRYAPGPRGPPIAPATHRFYV